MIDEKARVYADRDWWQAAGDVFGLELRGWTYRDTSVFADRETERRVEIPGWLAERILAYEPAKPKDAEGWRDIASAPKDGTAFLAHLPADRFPAVCLWQAYDPADAAEIGADGYWAFGEELIGDVEGHAVITHWRPLPEPPSAMLSAAGDGR